MGESFDYVIVGAGSAGCILANRLTADGRHSVCLLEAGPPDRHPLHPHPGGVHQDAGEPEAQLALSGRALALDRRPRDAGAAGQDARRLELDQRAYLQPRPAPRFRRLGPARQPRLGLRRRPAVLSSLRAADRRRRRHFSRPRGATRGRRHAVSASALRCLHRRGRRARHSPQPGLQRGEAGGRRLRPAHRPPGPAGQHPPPPFSIRPRRAPTSP